MAVYTLLNGSTVLVEVASNSSLDGEATKSTRRGRVFRTLGGGTVVQYSDSGALGERRIEWNIPRADGNQRAVLWSASVGTYADTLTLRTPKYGDLTVAFEPGEDGYHEEFLPPSFGYRLRLRLVRM